MVGTAFHRPAQSPILSFTSISKAESPTTAPTIQSQLNDTLTSDPGSTVLCGASFYSTSAASSAASGHIVAIIEKTLGGWQEVETILNWLTHNDTGAQIANAVQVSNSNVYLLHLPKDIQSRLPYINMVSSLPGEAPNYLSVGAVLEFVYNCLVSFATGLYHFAANLLQAGINLVCGIYSAVTTTITKIADAFNAFVQWAIEFIESMLNAILSPIVTPLMEAVADYQNGLLSSLQLCVDEYQSIGYVTNSALSSLGKALMGTLIDVVYIVFTAIEVALLALTVVTIGFAFLISFAISSIIGIVVENVIGFILQTVASGSTLADIFCLLCGSQFNINLAFNILQSNVNDEQNNQTSHGNQPKPNATEIGFTLSFIGYILSVFPMINSFFFESDDSGQHTSYAKKSLITAFISYMLTMISFGQTYINPLLSLIFAGIAEIFGMASLYYDWKDRCSILNEAKGLMSKIVFICSMGSVVLGGTALVVGVASYYQGG